MNAALATMAQQIQDLRTTFVDYRKSTPTSEHHTMGERHQSHSKAETSKKTLSRRETSHVDILAETWYLISIKFSGRKIIVFKVSWTEREVRGLRKPRTKTVHSMWQILLPLHVPSKEIKRQHSYIDQRFAKGASHLFWNEVWWEIKHTSATTAYWPCGSHS